MNAENELKSLCKAYSVEYKDQGGGHIQLSAHGTLVNYYPNSKNKTVYVKGGETVKHCSSWDAVRLCLQTGKVGLKPKKKTITKNRPPKRVFKSAHTNPIGIKYFYNGDTPPWEGEGTMRFYHPSDELRALAHVHEMKAIKLRAEAIELE